MVLEQVNYNAYVIVASITLLTYDYVLTFQSEVDLVWRSRMSPIKMLFFLTRYLAFVDMPLALLLQIGWNMDNKSCKWTMIICYVSLTIGILSAQLLFAMRTWALWGRRKPLAVILGFICVAIVIPSFASAGVYVTSENKHWITIPGSFGCISDTTPGPFIGVPYLLELVFETFLTILALYKVVYYYRLGSLTGLLFILSRDGVLFYIYSFAISFLNFIFIVTPSTRYKFGSLLTCLQRVMHAVFSWRLVLNLRGVEIDDSESTPSTLTEIQVSSRMFFTSNTGTPPSEGPQAS